MVYYSPFAMFFITISHVMPFLEHLKKLISEKRVKMFIVYSLHFPTKTLSFAFLE